MIKPLFDNVVIEKEKVSNQTASGIVLSNDAKETNYAIVLAVGEGMYVDGKLVPLPVKVGDKVIFKKYGTTEVKIDDKNYLIISAKDILGVIE